MIKEAPDRCGIVLTSIEILRIRLVAAVLLWQFLMVLSLGVSPLRAEGLRLITSPWPPSNYLSEDGRPTGLSVAVVEALKERVGETAPIEVIPWARGYLTAQQNPNVMLFTAGRTQERLDMGFDFIGPIVMWSHVLLAPRDNQVDVASLEDVRSKGLTVAGVRGSWQIKMIAEAGIQAVETEDHATAARMLLAGRVDFWFTSRLQASAVLMELGKRGDAVVPVHTVRRSPSYLMVSKGTDAAVLAAWRQAYADLLLTDFFDRTARDWSGRLGVPLQFRAEEGFVAESLDLGDTGS
ncbi:substrate-binding periplasmic protein [Roseibium sp.]|uniref:substrate-binding periplasmic protein n=1 Tax=Roseibium sp. TaxID=1936156 RepID=UPI003BAE5D5F